MVYSISVRRTPCRLHSYLVWGYQAKLYSVTVFDRDRRDCFLWGKSSSFFYFSIRKGNIFMYVKKHRVLLISLLSAVLLTTGTFSVSTSKAFADSLNPPPVPVSDSPSATSSSPVAAHGNLHVDGHGLTDCHGEKYQLRGMSVKPGPST